MKARMNGKIVPDENHQLLTSWLAVIGMLTLYWSPVERRIDQCVHLLQSALPTPRKKKPTRLGSKLDFIKDNMPLKIITPQELDSLTEQTKATVQIRDVCVHGVLKSFDVQTIEISKIDGRKDEHVIEVFTIDRDRLNRSADALSFLQEKWGAVASALLQDAGYA